MHTAKRSESETDRERETQNKNLYQKKSDRHTEKKTTIHHRHTESVRWKRNKSMYTHFIVFIKTFSETTATMMTTKTTVMMTVTNAKQNAHIAKHSIMKLP